MFSWYIVCAVLSWMSTCVMMSWCHVSWCHVMISCVMISCVMMSWCHVSWCHVSWYHVSWCHDVMSWCHVSWCHVSCVMVSWCHDIMCHDVMSWCHDVQTRAVAHAVLQDSLCSLIGCCRLQVSPHRLTKVSCSAAGGGCPWDIRPQRHHSVLHCVSLMDTWGVPAVFPEEHHMWSERTPRYTSKLLSVGNV